MRPSISLESVSPCSMLTPVQETKALSALYLSRASSVVQPV